MTPPPYSHNDGQNSLRKMQLRASTKQYPDTNQAHANTQKARYLN